MASSQLISLPNALSVSSLLTIEKGAFQRESCCASALSSESIEAKRLYLIYNRGFHCHQPRSLFSKSSSSHPSHQGSSGRQTSSFASAFFSGEGYRDRRSDSHRSWYLSHETPYQFRTLSLYRDVWLWVGNYRLCKLLR